MSSRGARRAVGYALAEAFAALTELTAPLPRCGVKDTALLLEMTQELGEWMHHAFPRELTPSGRCNIIYYA
jgi:hypothetical protein